MGRRSSVDDELARVREAAASPASPSAGAILAQALASKHARVVAAAAELVANRRLEGHAEALQSAFRRFLDEGPKRDPGCRAKRAVLEALDFTETTDPAPFLAAIELTQLEPAWGKPVDTAGPCRARGISALARLGHPDTALFAGPLLADREVSARLATAEALAATGARSAAGLLLLKLEVGDEDPLVTLACLSGVLALAPELGLARFVPWLSGADEGRQELAAMALGQSGRADAGQALIGALADCPLSKDRAVLLRALGLHRSDAALEAVLEVVDQGGRVDAVAAIHALAPRRFDPGLRARVERVVRGRAWLVGELAEVFDRP